MNKILLAASLAAMVMMSACGGEKSTPSGYRYTVLASGTGAVPKTGDYGYVHVYVYQDDSLVQSTREMGRTLPMPVPDFATMKAEDKVPGKANPVADAIAVMKVGDSISVNIPIDSVLLKNAPQLKDAKKLAYNIILLEVKTKEQYEEEGKNARMEAEAKATELKGMEAQVATEVAGLAKQYTSGSFKDKLQKTASGLEYVILEPGSGAQAEAGKQVEVNYYGILKDGTMFDNSYRNGAPIKFPLGQNRVIPGWEEGLALLKEGTKAIFFIPPGLAYGAQGSPPRVPGNSQLIFLVKLEKVGM